MNRQLAAGDDGRVVRCPPVVVDDDDLVAERGAKAGVLPAVDADVGPHVVAAADLRPPVTKTRPVAGHAAADDGDQASARLEPQEGLLDVAGSEGGAVSVDAAAGGREGRIHHDGVIGLLRGKEIVEAFGVERRRLEPLQAEQFTPAGVDFIGVHVRPEKSGENRDIARSGTRLQDRHPRTEGGRLDDHQCLGRRRAELLELNLRLVASGLEGQPGLLGEKPVDRGGDVAKVNPRPMQIDVQSRLGGVIGVTAVPGRTAENLLGQAGDCPVVELGRRVGLQEGGQMSGQLCDRTRHRGQLRGRLRLREPVEIQEHLVGVEATATARIGPTAASPSVRGYVVVLDHGLVDVMGRSHAGLHTRQGDASEANAGGDKAMSSLDISAATPRRPGASLPVTRNAGALPASQRGGPRPEGNEETHQRREFGRDARRESGVRCG